LPPSSPADPGSQRTPDSCTSQSRGALQRIQVLAFLRRRFSLSRMAWPWDWSNG
jgi:hypothetical protein